MPLKRNNQSAPPVMTWTKATPVLVVAILFDAVRLFFALFWLLGPALAALYCTVKGSGLADALTFGLLGTKTAAVVCSAAAIVAGTAVSAATTAFGVMMAMAVGIFGWLTVIFLILITNSRLFRDDASSILWTIGSLALSEIPFLDALPALTATVWRLYHAQIKGDKKKRAAYEKETRQYEAQRQRTELAQLQALQVEQLARQEAANDATAAASANDEEYGEEIPARERRVA